MKKIVSMLLVLALVILWSSSAVTAQGPVEESTTPPEMSGVEALQEPTPTPTVVVEIPTEEVPTEEPTEVPTEEPTEVPTEEPTE
ncbi:MAG: hypothetical protein ACP5R2_12705, partial [Anaerolineae bacterium]